MAITCPQCGRGYDVTLFQFDHRVRCFCGAELAFPGEGLRSGHIRLGLAIAKGGPSDDYRSGIRRRHALFRQDRRRGNRAPSRIR